MLTIFIIGLVYIGTDGDNILAQDITANKVYRKSWQRNRSTAFVQIDPAKLLGTNKIKSYIVVKISSTINKILCTDKEGKGRSQVS